MIFMKIHIISTFRRPEIKESAECTKHYKFLGQIGVSGARNHLFREIHLYLQKSNFRRKRFSAQKSENGPAAAHHAQTLLKPMLFYRFWRPSGPESGKSGKKCDFHPFPLIFMKFGENDLKSAIFTHFHQFYEEWREGAVAYLIWLPFKAQIVMRNQHSCIPSWWRIPVLRSSEPFCAKNFRRKLDFCKKKMNVAKKVISGSRNTNLA